MSKAKEMLLSDEKNITEIAIVCGFNSPNYLSNAFKKIKGITPRQFRQQNKKHDLN